MPRSLTRALAVASAVAVATIMLSGCTTALSGHAVDTCSGVIAKVLLTDDSANAAATFNPGDVPKIFAVPGTPAPTCYYSSIVPPSTQGAVASVDTHRTLLYIGLSDSQADAIIASIRKTVSVAPWTVRFDYGAPAAAPGATASPTPGASNSTSARWYYNFAGGPSDDKGEMGYYYSKPMSQGAAIQAGLSKPANLLRVETDLRQVKK